MITPCLPSVLALGKNGDGHIAAAPSERKLHRQGTTVPVTAVPHMRCDPHHFGRHGTSRPLTQVKNLSEAINQCLQRAGDCARKAAAESDPKIKADFLDTKRRWTALARNYEFAKRLTDGAKQNDKLPKVRTRY